MLRVSWSYSNGFCTDCASLFLSSYMGMVICTTRSAFCLQVLGGVILDIDVTLPECLCVCVGLS
jgi:hypothetical protein